MRGVTIILYEKTQTGVDAFNNPVFEENPIEVENVLIGEPSSEDVINEINMSGHRLAYTLAIPKGDKHTWTDCRVNFFGEDFHVFAKPTQGIDHLIPLAWNKKVKVECYE